MYKAQIILTLFHLNKNKYIFASEKHLEIQF